MKRVLLTGMSGTGKSTMIRLLAARGYKAVDTDTDEWSEWVTVPGDGDGDGDGDGAADGDGDGAADGVNAERDWVWREERIRRLLATADTEVLFVSGCKSNQGKFRAQFDHVILLSAPPALLVERLKTRTTNPYGKRPGELTRILGHVQTVEPLLRKSATLEVDTSVPVEQVLEAILRHVGA